MIRFHLTNLFTMAVLFSVFSPYVQGLAALVKAVAQ